MKCANKKPWLDDRIIGIYPVRNNAPLEFLTGFTWPVKRDFA
jgi:hypothetical protein